MRTKNLELCQTLISQAINETIERWANRPEHLKDYAWGFRWVDEGGFTVGNNHGKTFYEAGTVIDIARVCGCNYYLGICDNEDGEPTPCVDIF